MAEYREQVKHLREWTVLDIQNSPAYTIRMMQAAADTIEKFDAVPVVQGRWEHMDDDLFDLWRCTACGEEWTFSYDPTDADTKVNYCPECGARMDGDTDD